MDGDSLVVPELGSLGLILPLPYRIALFAVMATWGWGINLHYLSTRAIDVPALLRYPGRASALHPPHHASAYRLAAAMSSCLGSSLLLFWVLTRGDAQRVLAYDWLPMVTLAVLAVVLAVPMPRWLARRLPTWTWTTTTGSPTLTPAPPLWSLPQDGRRRFAATLRRVAVGGLAETHSGRFADILLADVLTSCARALGDVYVCLCMFFVARSANDRPDRSCGSAVVVPLIVAAPSLARFRQCLIDYLRVQRMGGVGGGGQHLANALKYFTAFPVILFATLQRQAVARAGDAGDAGNAAAASAAALYRAWFVAVVVNSLYSFYWDVAKDWDLMLFEDMRRSFCSGSSSNDGSLVASLANLTNLTSRPAPAHTWGLRRRLLLRPAPLVYYSVIVLDLSLRCTWLLRLSPGLAHVADVESGIFVLQGLEMLRRWVWLFFRIETEWIRTSGNGSGNGNGNSAGAGGGNGLLGTGMDPTDILLGNYQGKYDDEDE